MPYENHDRFLYRSRAGRFPGAVTKVNGRPAYEAAPLRRAKHPGRRISKREFYDKGGFGNPRLYRQADKQGRWYHYELPES